MRLNLTRLNCVTVSPGYSIRVIECPNDIPLHGWTFTQSKASTLKFQHFLCLFFNFSSSFWTLHEATFKFSITYKYDPEYTAIFNTGIENVVKNRDWTTNHYHKTMKMPTYLLAILVSDFSLENYGISEKGVEVRIIGRKEGVSNWKIKIRFFHFRSNR